MTDQSLHSITPTIDIYIRLAQYPILADVIRERMRQELFDRGIVSPEAFEAEVKELSIDSQRREGLGDPYIEEDSDTWHLRKERIREYHTDFYYANNLGNARLDVLINQILDSQSGDGVADVISFNPEIAPWEMLFRQGEIYERMAREAAEDVAHHLEEIKVVLIKRLMSDQLPFIGVARRYLTIGDLRQIHNSLIGTGKIGGKSSGMILAWRILQSQPQDFSAGTINIADSFFIGTDVIYEFFLMNRLEHHMNQKYRPIQEIREEHPGIVEEFRAGDLPEIVIKQISGVLESLGNSPLVVRSSSLLEDNFGHSFAGKYPSYFCPNQGTPDENLEQVLDAIKRVYASALNPDALLYRKKHGLLDYDERMAILLQRITGHAHGRYFYPDLAGVGFSRNPFLWAPEIRSDEGFLRLVAGLGTRAVERVASDYPRLVALSHPALRPERTAAEQRTYSQRFMAAVDLETNSLATVPVREALTEDSQLLALVSSLDDGRSLTPIADESAIDEQQDLVLTFDALLTDPDFAGMMRAVLQHLESAYQMPVDLEFAVDVDFQDAPRALAGDHTGPTYHLYVLECRPMNRRVAAPSAASKTGVPQERSLFATPTRLPTANLRDIRYVIFVDPERYYALENDEQRLAVSSLITQLNDALPAYRFAIVGPGRWGSLNSRLSVPVTYSDICNSLLLLEISPAYAPAPEVACGTDFNADLEEVGIVNLGIHPAAEGAQFDWDFFRHGENTLEEFIAGAGAAAGTIRVIDIAAETSGMLAVTVDAKKARAVGYIVPGPSTIAESPG